MKPDFFLTAVVLIVLIPAYAQPDTVMHGKKHYQTTRIKGASPFIDGILADDEWGEVDWGGDFIQRSPSEGLPPTEQTAFKILYDDKNLYVGIRCFDREPDKIVKRMGRRDDFPGDWVEINIDSYFDQTTAFSFTTSASGVKGDEAVTNNGDNWDSSWDPVWHVKTRVDSLGWTVEIRIPFSQLRFNYKPEQTWGIQLTRKYFRKDEISVWQFISKQAPGWVHLFGELHGLNEVLPQKQLEIQPYVVSKIEKLPPEAGNPYINDNQMKFSAGLDSKIGVGSAFTIDLTLNPDFGQVEADPSVVNLSGFQNYFGERRPFFVEGKEIYNYQVSPSIAWGDHNSDNLFYSRRIGRKPHISPDIEDDEFIKQPDNTTILGAAKLTGRTPTGWTVGIMESLTKNEFARISGEEGERQTLVEPFTNYFVSRIRKDYNKGNTRIGGIFTSVNRNIKNTALENKLHHSAYVGGVDYIHNWKDRTYYLYGNMIFSQIRGSKSSIASIQQNHEHYYQRTNANHVEVDTALTQLSGFAGTMVAGKGGNSPIRFQGGFTVRSPGVEFNDIGFMRSADLIDQFFWAGYSLKNATKVLRSFGFNVNEWSYWDFSGQNTYNALNFNTNGTFVNYWSMAIGLTHHFETISNTDLRGGPSLLLPSGTTFWYNVESDRRKKVRYGFYYEVYAGNELYLTRNYIDFWINYQPVDALSINLSPEFAINKSEMQYVETIDLPNRKFYIVSGIRQRTLSASIRLNLNLSPNLTLQYYGQPFISKGEYSDFRRITNPKAKEYENRFYRIKGNEITYHADDKTYSVKENSSTSAYSFDNPDYNFVQFRSNLVLRWEYIPGSTLFLVWSEDRSDEPGLSRPAIPELSKKLWRAPSSDIFLLKFSYRFLN